MVEAAPSAVRPHAELNRAWNLYGDTGGRWSGGDSTVSVRLPDGRTAWLFSDTFVGRVFPGGVRASDTVMVHNALVIQDGAEFTTIHGGTPERPESWVGTTADGTLGDPQFWIGDALVEGGELRVLFNRFVRTGPGAFDIAGLGPAVASFSLPGLARTDLRPLPVSTVRGWGASFAHDDEYTYVYGAEPAGTTKWAHVARARRGDLLGAWQFWTGRGWSPHEADSVRILPHVGGGYGVVRVGGRWVLVTQELEVPFSPLIVGYDAPSPTGPFGRRRVLWTAPEARGKRIIYDARIHEELSGPRELVVSYNVNDLDFWPVLSDARLYRPRFLRVPWPRP